MAQPRVDIKQMAQPRVDIRREIEDLVNIAKFNIFGGSGLFSDSGLSSGSSLFGSMYQPSSTTWLREKVLSYLIDSINISINDANGKEEPPEQLQSNIETSLREIMIETIDKWIANNKESVRNAIIAKVPKCVSAKEEFINSKRPELIRLWALDRLYTDKYRDYTGDRTQEPTDEYLCQYYHKELQRAWHDIREKNVTIYLEIKRDGTFVDGVTLLNGVPLSDRFNQKYGAKYAREYFDNHFKKYQNVCDKDPKWIEKTAKWWEQMWNNISVNELEKFVQTENDGKIKNQLTIDFINQQVDKFLNNSVAQTESMSPTLTETNTIKNEAETPKEFSEQSASCPVESGGQDIKCPEPWISLTSTPVS